MRTASSSSSFVIAACATAAAAVVVLTASACSTVPSRAEVEAEAPAPAPAMASTPSAGLDLSPWRALPPSPAIRIPRSILEDVDALAQAARIVPAFEQGVAVGFKVFEIREGSVFAQIGLHDDDVLIAVNGLSVAAPELALAVAEQLRTAPTAQLSIRRRGEPVRLDVVFE